MSKPSMLLALAALTACAVQPPESTVGEPASLSDGKVSYGEWQDNKAAGDEALRQLKELDFIDIGALIVDAPDASGYCYGPCEDDATDQVWMQEHAWQVARLEELTETTAAIAADSPTANPAEKQASLDALEALQIVEVRWINPEETSHCYTFGCPGDERRAGILQALAEQTKGL